jgi:hypothetical protein
MYQHEPMSSLATRREALQGRQPPTVIPTPAGRSFAGSGGGYSATRHGQRTNVTVPPVSRALATSSDPETRVIDVAMRMQAGIERVQACRAAEARILEREARGE